MSTLERDSRYYHLTNIRTLFTEGFSDWELRELCHDTDQLRFVYHQLAQNTGKTEIVTKLLEYANQNSFLDPLLVWAKEKNPAKYEAYQPYISLSKVYLNPESDLFLPTPEQVLAHRESIARKPKYHCWADESFDEYFISEESKVLPLLASPYEDDTGQRREDLLKIIRTHDRLLILGEPGMGKTVAMHRMMWETAQGNDPVVPIFVPLLFSHNNLIKDVRLALSETGELHFDDPKVVKVFLRQARCLIMFDGLNEVPGKHREQAVEAIADFLREFPKHRYVITSRSQDELWKTLRTGGVIEEAVVIQRITNRQVQNYLIGHLGNQKGKELYGRLDERLRGLARTPLLLWLIKEAGLAGEELPGNRGELFDRFVDRILNRDKDKKLGASIPSTIKKNALAHLAFTLQQSHQLVCSREKVIELLTQIEHKYNAETILQEILTHGLLQGEQQVCFLHQSMQEYFVALALCRVAQSERQSSTLQRVGRRLLRRNLVAWARDDWWSESFVQLAGLTENPSWLAQEVISVKPWLAFWCSIEGKPIDEGTRRIVEANSIALLQSEDAIQRLKAVRELGRVENPRAIGYLVKVLSDKDERIIDAATQVLATLGEPAVEPLLEVLYGNERIRWAATRALGQIWGITDLVKLGDNNKEVRQKAANALGQLQDEPGERAIDPLIAALQEGDLSVRSAVAQALGQLGNARAIGPLIELLKISDHEMRSGISKALINLGNATIEPLIITLNELNDEEIQQKFYKKQSEILEEKLGASLVRDLWSQNGQLRVIANAKALKLLGNQGIESLNTALRQIREDVERSTSVRQNIIEVLGNLGDMRVAEYLTNLLIIYSDSSMQRVIIRALGRIWQLPDIIKLGDHDKEMRLVAVKALGGSGNERALEPLAVTLKDKHLIVSQEAAKALARLGIELAHNDAFRMRALDLLLRIILYEADLWARRGAMQAFGQISQLPYIIELGSNDTEVRRKVVEVLIEITEKQISVPEVICLIASRKDLDKQVQQSADRGLKRLIPLLHFQAITNEDQNFRGIMAILLQAIGTSEALSALQEYQAQEKQRIINRELKTPQK